MVRSFCSYSGERSQASVLDGMKRVRRRRWDLCALDSLIYSRGPWDGVSSMERLYDGNGSYADGDGPLLVSYRFVGRAAWQSMHDPSVTVGDLCESRKLWGHPCSSTHRRPSLIKAWRKGNFSSSARLGTWSGHDAMVFLSSSWSLDRTFGRARM